MVSNIYNVQLDFYLQEGLKASGVTYDVVSNIPKVSHTEVIYKKNTYSFIVHSHIEQKLSCRVHDLRCVVPGLSITRATVLCP